MKASPIDPGKRIRTQSGVPIFPAVDGLRWLAVVLVIAYHVWGGTSYHVFRGTPVASLIGCGVGMFDLLFILSGFVMFLPAAARGGDLGSTRSYAIRRVARIVPAYYVCLALIIAAYPLLSNQARFSSFGATAILAHLTFLHTETWMFPSLADRVPFGFGVDGAVWTLSVEAIFYLALPFVARAFYRRPVLLLVLALALSATLRAVSAPIAAGWLHLLGDQAPPSSVHTIAYQFALQFPCFVNDFAIGMFSAWLVVRLQRQPLGRRQAACGLGAAALALVFVALYVPPNSRTAIALLNFHGNPLAETLVPVALGVLLVGILLAPARACRPLTNRVISRLGEMSYGTYLYHLPLLFFGVFTLHIYFRASASGYLKSFVFTLVTACLAGWLSYTLIEVPLRTRAQRLAARVQRSSRRKLAFAADQVTS
jgi:peptidoglycan/LPS O-acetylase OafA/YrhL